MGTTKEAFDLLVGDYRAIRRSEFISKNRTIEAIAGEVAELIVDSAKDRPTFAKISRFDLTMIDTLPTRRDGFLYAFTEYEAVSMDPGAAKIEYDASKPVADALKKKFIGRRRLIAEEEGDKIMLTRLAKVAVGNGKRDIHIDFEIITDIATKDAEKLDSMGFTADDLKQVVSMEKRLRTLVGSLETPPEIVLEKKDMMNRAYTYLAMAETMIKEYGRILFEGTDRESAYISKSLSDRSGLQSKTSSDENLTDSLGI